MAINDFIKAAKNIKGNSKLQYRDVINELTNTGEVDSAEFDDLDDEACSESINDLLKGKVWPGCIYTFKYTALLPTKYNGVGQNAEKPLYFADDNPIVLVFSTNKETIRGINLNFCNEGLKTIILNLFYNLDDKFYKGGCEQKILAGQLPLSDKTISFLASNGEAKIINALKSHYSKVDFDFLVRTYKISAIEKIMLIEPSRWKYLPAMEYSGKLKGAVLTEIQRLSGISTIKI